MKSIFKKIFIQIIRVYQKIISPLFPRTCRFYPTCSEYMLQAVERYGIIKGLYKGLKRLIRCHPFNTGGYDPVQ